MHPKRTSTSEAPAMTQAVIKKLVADSVSTAMKAQAANMANTDNITRLREAPVARQCSYKEFMSCQPINFKGSELTKEDRESQLYDDFEHFRQHKGETIHDYYVRFAKLINDMRNIKMTMSRMQLNSKFVNNMLPEWGRFVTAVKLNRGLRDSNYDQLYAYLKQHEAHANENKMLLDRFTQHIVDPLALMSNVAPQ
ncbi:hypothetical protein Tco_0001393 [Tanacetum coccineum]